ncbi:MAG TPA: N-6 DNA methylase, partial [Candidatus Kapabacteria bacterium]|nr:N-6 DNA methylase [Candidatus Kapabacteria bacterium]
MQGLALIKQKAVEIALTSPEGKLALQNIADEIRGNCINAPNEATVASVFEINLFSALKDLTGKPYYPEKELSVGTIRHTSKGRVDSKIGALVIEFKSRLRSDASKIQARNQLSEYLDGLYVKNKNASYVGLVTDGVFCTILQYEKGVLIEHTQYAVISGVHLDILVRAVANLDKTALTPENLVKDFCEGNNVAKELTKTLYVALAKRPTDKTKMLFQEWQQLFRLAHNDKSKQKPIKERKAALSQVIGRQLANADEEYRVLFALQTTYAIIIKVIAYRVISKIRLGKSLIDYNSLSTATSESLRERLTTLEEGAIFRNLGVANLLEGDFFSWYCSTSQWSDEIAAPVQHIFCILANYEDRPIFDTDHNVQDLFKDLFMHIIPSKVRHSLGEYYTPPWLAEHLISEAITLRPKPERWKALDPCAGSGTFLTILIKKVLDETQGMTKRSRLHEILIRVKGIDLNPLAVLTARINYFINVSPLLDGEQIEIPVYLGDSSYVPKEVKTDGVACLNYSIKTLKATIEINLPKSAVSNPRFSQTMMKIEDDIAREDVDAICKKLLSLLSKSDRTFIIESQIRGLAEQFVELQLNEWDGIWARITANFLTTANLGKFDYIVGNPPWIDWKNLPEGYRERVKTICRDRALFSGDAMTGGINLNICALISNIAAQNWLAKDGVLGFLMPQNILFQKSYEGFRNFQLDNGERLYFQKVFDWKNAGGPFKPVVHPFLTYLFSEKKQDYSLGIPLIRYKKNNRVDLTTYKNASSFSTIASLFDVLIEAIVQTDKRSTAFSYVKDKRDAGRFMRVTGDCQYIARDGIDFYPKELFMLQVDKEITGKSRTKGSVIVRNKKNNSTDHKIDEFVRPMETRHLYPLIQGKDVKRFHITPSDLIVPFPYKNFSRSPIPIKTLSEESPEMAKFLQHFKKWFSVKTDYTKKIIGKKNNTEFYALARVGNYTYGKNFVVFRKDTEWCAAVVTSVKTPWGGRKAPRFLSHAAYISQDKSGKFITENEAHFICAILNAPICKLMVESSSDNRSFKIKHAIHIPTYSPNNVIHSELVEISKKAHKAHP